MACGRDGGIVNEDIRNEIVRRWQGRTSQRRIAKDLGVARDTVQSVIRGWEAERAGQQTSGELAAPARRSSQLDAYDDAIRQLLDRYPDITATRVFEELRRQGFTGRYTIVRQRVKHWRPRPSREPVVRFETPPGAQAQMDYSTYDIDFTAEGRRRVHLFSYVLGYSRRQYSALRRVPRLGDDPARTHSRLRTLGRRGPHLSIRQHEGRCVAPWRRRAVL